MITHFFRVKTCEENGFLRENPSVVENQFIMTFSGDFVATVFV